MGEGKGGSLHCQGLDHTFPIIPTVTAVEQVLCSGRPLLHSKLPQAGAQQNNDHFFCYTSARCLGSGKPSLLGVGILQLQSGGSWDWGRPEDYSFHVSGAWAGGDTDNWGSQASCPSSMVPPRGCFGEEVGG